MKLDRQLKKHFPLEGNAIAVIRITELLRVKGKVVAGQSMAIKVQDQTQSLVTNLLIIKIQPSLKTTICFLLYILRSKKKRAFYVIRSNQLKQTLQHKLSLILLSLKDSFLKDLLFSNINMIRTLLVIVKSRDNTKHKEILINNHVIVVITMSKNNIHLN
jgi:hypothetical protein